MPRIFIVMRFVKQIDIGKFIYNMWLRLLFLEISKNEIILSVTFLIIVIISYIKFIKKNQK